jgi:hypothetical protein
MKKLILLISFVGVAFVYNACSPGYVAEQPIYVESIRPPQPTINHIWINDNWVYNRRTNQYMRNNGNWIVPNRGRTYQQGQWKYNGRGHYWVPGRWR